MHVRWKINIELYFKRIQLYTSADTVLNEHKWLKFGYKKLANRINEMIKNQVRCCSVQRRYALNLNESTALSHTQDIKEGVLLGVLLANTYLS